MRKGIWENFVTCMSHHVLAFRGVCLLRVLLAVLSCRHRDGKLRWVGGATECPSVTWFQLPRVIADASVLPVVSPGCTDRYKVCHMDHWAWKRILARDLNTWCWNPGCCLPPLSHETRDKIQQHSPKLGIQCQLWLVYSYQRRRSVWCHMNTKMSVSLNVEL